MEGEGGNKEAEWNGMGFASGFASGLADLNESRSLLGKGRPGATLSAIN